MIRRHLSGRPCPVCEGREGLIIRHLCYALFDDLEMSGQKTLLECSQCGMLYDDVHFSENQLREYYRRNEHYAISSLGGSGSATEDNEARYNRIIDLLKRYTNGKIIDLDGTIIDFGCGQGGFVSRCLQCGLKAVGIEPSVKNREMAQGEGIQVYESVYDFFLKNAGRKIQAVVFSHVLEHLMNPLGIVRDFAKYANGALVYIEVPDAASYLFPDAIRWQEMYFEHLSHFRKRDLTEFAWRSSIEIKDEGEIPFSKMQKDIRCRFVVGRFADTQKQGKVPAFSDDAYDSVSQIPFVSVESVMEGDRPLGLWGVSQYAMLLMGSCTGLAGRVRRLFDASPAKMGRSIQGIIVESPVGLGTLSDDFILLIPKSTSLPQMRSILPGIGFKGKVVEV
jgi:SAM-dependent methyltransferase